VREQAANFMLSICSDFESSSSLFEIQKINPGDEDATVNFHTEPNKSKK
jgi:hypothetical protein